MEIFWNEFFQSIFNRKELKLVRTAHSFVHFFAVTARLRRKLNKPTTIFPGLYSYRLQK